MNEGKDETNFFLIRFVSSARFLCMIIAYSQKLCKAVACKDFVVNSERLGG